MEERASPGAGAIKYSLLPIRHMAPKELSTSLLSEPPFNVSVIAALIPSSSGKIKLIRKRFRGGATGSAGSVQRVRGEVGIHKAMRGSEGATAE